LQSGISKSLLTRGLAEYIYIMLGGAVYKINYWEYLRLKIRTFNPPRIYFLELSLFLLLRGVALWIIAMAPALMHNNH